MKIVSQRINKLWIGLNAARNFLVGKVHRIVNQVVICNYILHRRSPNLADAFRTKGNNVVSHDDVHNIGTLYVDAGATVAGASIHRVVQYGYVLP